jgi:hypothetical protein
VGKQRTARENGTCTLKKHLTADSVAAGFAVGSCHLAHLTIKPKKFALPAMTLVGDAA